MDSHRAAFVAEAEDGITDLNNALLALEADPEDGEAMDDVFRVAHTLKGNAAAMGYDRVSEFGHALEDLLDDVRTGNQAVTPELMDLLFEGVDAVEAMVAEIAEDGEVSTDPSELEARIRDLEAGSGSTGAPESADPEEPTDAEAVADVEDGATEASEADADGADADDPATGSADADDASVDLPPAAADLDVGDDVLVHADVTIGETQMPGVDATFVTEAIADGFDAFATDPAPDALEAGEFDTGFDAFVVAEAPDVVATSLDALTQVEAVEVARVGGGDAVGTADADPEAAGTGTEESVSGGETTENEGPTTAGNAVEADAADADDADAADADDADAADTDDADAADTDDADAADTDDANAADADDADAADADDVDEISSIRVDVDQVDELYGLVEQLVTSRIKLRRELEEAGIESDTLGELDKLASSLQDTAMDMRLIPFSQVADSFPRLVRDVAREVGKDVQFAVTGGDVELDRTILTEMRDPLVHVLRNAVDHGIEPPEEREAAGKDPTGTVQLTATRDRDHVVIEVTDDGAGLDPDRLRAKAVEEGVHTPAELDAMDESEIYDLVFHPGLSTAEEVTDVSGRGVGMDVVRTTARSLDGSVEIESEPGEGSTVRFRLPVTVAIVKVMFVDVGGTEYGIPIKSIAEVGRADDVETVNGDEILRHEGDLYPVIRLEERLADSPSASAGDGADPDAPPTTGGGVADGGEVADGGAVPDDSEVPGHRVAGDNDGVDDDGMVVRIREETRQVALQCDAVLDQEEVVVKPLDGPLSGTPGLSGTAVLGDGDVVAVLDVVSL
ncbi:MAG: chemotaxis protein CheA [Halopenitus sp.]